MRHFIAVVLVAVAAIVAGHVQAADLPQYPPVINVPVDNGLGGSFYLRGSAGLNVLWAREANYQDCGCSVDPITSHTITTAGYGYSFGAGFGYEVGNGLRADATIDYLSNSGLSDGVYKLDLRSTIALANVYYDFGLDGHSGAGGFGAYVGAGIGGAYNMTHITGGVAPGPDGANFTAAGALMAGVSYDMGTMVADVGYRMIYMPQITNGDAALTPASPYYINNNVINEIRASLRYRLN